MTLAEILTIQVPEGGTELGDAAAIMRRLMEEPGEEALAQARQYLSSYVEEDEETSAVLDGLLGTF